MPDWLRWVLAALACYRLAQLVAVDDGPFALCKRLRQALGRRAGAEGSWRWSLAELANCPYCLGVWFAVPCAWACLGPSGPTDAILAWLGLAGAQALMEERDGT